MSKSYGIEFVRVVAIFAVVVIHAYPSWTEAGAFVGQVARFAVPFFFIVAGYFFQLKLARLSDGQLTYVWQYLWRIGLIYLTWHFVYSVWPIFSVENWGQIHQAGFYSAIKAGLLDITQSAQGHLAYFLFAGGRGFHLWFLPSLAMGISLLFIANWCRCFAVGCVVALALFVVALLVGPYKVTSVGLDYSFNPRNGPFFSSIFVFLGAILAKRWFNASFLMGTVLIFVGLIIHMAEVYWLEYNYSVPVSKQDFVVGTIFYGLGVFILAIKWQPEGQFKTISQLGRCTLGIYVVHVLVLYSLNLLPDITAKEPFFRVLYTFIVSLIIVIYLKKIPYLNRLV